MADQYCDRHPWKKLVYNPVWQCYICPICRGWEKDTQKGQKVLDSKR